MLGCFQLYPFLESCSSLGSTVSWPVCVGYILGSVCVSLPVQSGKSSCRAYRRLFPDHHLLVVSVEQRQSLCSGLDIQEETRLGTLYDSELLQDTRACYWLFAHTEQWAGAIAGKEVSPLHNGRHLSLTVVHIQHPHTLFWEG